MPLYLVEILMSVVRGRGRLPVLREEFVQVEWPVAELVLSVEKLVQPLASRQ